jgi:hypothetical protein
MRSIADLLRNRLLVHNVCSLGAHLREANMNGLIYLVGLIVVVMIILSFFGLR